MSVDDLGTETLRKAAEQVTPGDKAEYLFRVKVKSSDNTGFALSTLNAHAGALAALATFTGVAESVTSYPETTISIFGAPSSAPAVFYFEYSLDGLAWPVSVPYVLAGPNSFVPLPLRNILPFFRVRYVNGAVPLTDLHVVVTHHWQTSNDLTRVLNQSIDENEPVKNVRAFIGGQSPDGPFTNLPASGVLATHTTATLLGANATYTSGIRSTQGFVAIAASIIASHASAMNGLVFKFYADAAGTRLVKESAFTYASAGIGIYRQVPANQGPYVRISFTNGATAQTSFELITQLITTAPPSELSDINELITDATAATVVKSNIVGKKENGIYSSVGLSNSSSVKVAISDRPSEVRGRTPIYLNVSRTDLTPAGTVIYTVTAGKTLYISNFLFTALNDDTAIGEWRIQDAAILRGSFLLPNRTAGVPSAAATTAPTLPEPMKFSTNVNLVEITGVIIVSGFLIGYEE